MLKNLELLWSLPDYVLVLTSRAKWVGKLLLGFLLVLVFWRILFYVVTGNQAAPLWFFLVGVFDSPVVQPAGKFVDWFLTTVFSLVFVIVSMVWTRFKGEKEYPMHLHIILFWMGIVGTIWYLGIMELPFSRILGMIGLVFGLALCTVPILWRYFSQVFRTQR